MQRTEPFDKILDSAIQARLGADYLKELSADELVQELIHGDNQDTDLYQEFCKHMEQLLVPSADPASAPDPSSDLIFVPTTKALRFYKSYFRRQLADVLFVGVDDPADMDAVIKQRFSASCAKHTDSVDGKEANSLAATEEQSPPVDSPFERFKLAQRGALEDLVAELKRLKRDTGTKTGQDLHVLFTDIKEAPAHIQLIKDSNPVREDSVALPSSLLLNPTIRLLRFGYLYNERTQALIKMADALSSRELQEELTRDESNVYTLKYRPSLSADFDWPSFVTECLSDSSSQKPYLECSACEAASEAQGADAEAGVAEINRENFKQTLGENKLTVIAVFARKCSACRELEPKLSQLQRMLKEEVGHSKVGVAKVDIFNEVHFLKHVEKTPTFLLHEKKGDLFWDVGSSDFSEIVKTADRIHKRQYRL